MPNPTDHLALLQECMRVTASAVDDRPRCAGRQPTLLQCLRQRVRHDVADCAQHFQQQGLTLEQRGALLHLSPRTLRYWAEACMSPPIPLTPVGRPLLRPPVPVRQEIVAYLKLTGPGVGVPTLQEHFPDVARRELADLLERFRVLYRACRRQPQRVLHWQTPGRVWAADFTEPSCYGGAGLPPIADRYPYVLAVRDLASGMMLAWEPLPNLTEEVTSAALARLYALHGAPLILKLDNGSAFRATAFQDCLQESGVIPLYSPPSCPGYNGSIEAAIGSLKNRTEQHAREQGHAGRWQPADLAAAQSAANASHPRRLNGRTPSALWEARSRVEPLERVVFALTAERHRFQVREELGIAWDESLDHWRHSAVDRRALERALVEHDHLLFTGRTIPLTNKAGKMTSDV